MTKKPIQAAYCQQAFNCLCMVATLLCFLNCTPVPASRILDFQEIKSQLENAPSGSIVTLPDGTCFITEPIIVTRSLTILGAGIDRTIFRAQVPGAHNAFLLSSRNADGVRISGITFDMAAQANWGGLELLGHHQAFRVDHCKFTESPAQAVDARSRPLFLDGWYGEDGDLSGLVDHCLFQNNRATDIIYLGEDETAWQQPRLLGSAITQNGGLGVVFIEDCTFLYEDAWLANNSPGLENIASNSGSRYVFRHNVIDAGGTTEHNLGCLIDAHGNYEGNRGSFSFEVYENDIRSDKSYRCMNFRGGTGVVFNNRLWGKITVPLNFLDYRSFKAPRYDYHGTACPHGFVATTCPDLAPNPPHSPDQINQVYIWNNSYNGDTSAFFANVDDRGHNRFVIQENRDFFLVPAPDYAPYPYPHPQNRD